MLVDVARHLYYHLPQSFQRAVLVRRRECIWLEAGLLFIHVPKAAGTSINEVLYGRFMGHVRATDVERWGSPALKSLPRFAITRNPWDRLVSAYRFLRRGEGIGGRNAGHVWRAEQYRRPEFASFDAFVREWLARRDPEKLDVALQPQSLFVCDGRGRLLVDQIGRYEDLDASYAAIRCMVRGLPKFADSNRSGPAVDYRTFYTPELAELVGSIYANDVETFAYSFD